MKTAFLLNCVSAHQVPLAKEVSAAIGFDNFLYVDAGQDGQEFQTVDASDEIRVERLNDRNSDSLENIEVVYTGLRNLQLLENRAAKGLKTFYYSERWFKPFHGLPGCLRMLVPSYRRMVKRFVNWANTAPGAKVLAIGPHAKRDFVRMGVALEKIVDWGYYVEPTHALPSERGSGTILKLLWCGRLLGWKRVGDIVRAISEHVGLERGGVSLTIIGDGPERKRLMRLAESLPITFLPSQSADRIREIMRGHDTFVLSSNAYEGWGAVVSEALEEGMNVIGTYEAGASAAILPNERLYHAGDVNALVGLIAKEMSGELPPCSIGGWTAKHAAERFLEMSK